MPWENESAGEAVRGWQGSPTDPWLEDLIRTYGPALYGFLLGATPDDRRSAGDLTRETFRRAWQILEPLGPDVDDVGAWLFTIARRVAIDHARAWRNGPGGAGAEETGNAIVAVSTTEIRADDQAVRMALGLLGSDHRRVVAEIYGRGRSLAEAASMLGISVAMARQRAYDALRVVRAGIDGAASGRTIAV